MYENDTCANILYIPYCNVTSVYEKKIWMKIDFMKMIFCFSHFQSYDEERHLVQTSVGWDCNHSTDDHQDHGAFLYQIHEANKEADHLFEFLTKISTIVCNTCKYYFV